MLGAVGGLGSSVGAGGVPPGEEVDFFFFLLLFLVWIDITAKMVQPKSKVGQGLVWLSKLNVGLFNCWTEVHHRLTTVGTNK